MDRWGWQHSEPWLDHRPALPDGALLCVMPGPTAGRPWSATAARSRLRDLAATAGVRRRFAPHQLRHAHAVEVARERVPLTIVTASAARASKRQRAPWPGAALLIVRGARERVTGNSSSSVPLWDAGSARGVLRPVAGRGRGHAHHRVAAVAAAR
jgi:hypothetical protein